MSSRTDAMIASGPAYWLRGDLLMLRWELMSLRLLLPIMLVVQIFMGAGLVIGFGLLFDEVPPIQALYLSTGSTVIAMLVVGLTMAPQLVAQKKMQNTYDFLWSLPVPRVAAVMANLSVWMMVSLPGVVLALMAARLRYDLDLHVSLLVLPAALLSLLVASSVGFAYAHALPPMVTALVTQVLAFVVLVYSPINFPAERLPGWLQSLHRVLPFEHAANVMRAGLTRDLADDVGFSFLVLSAWALGGWIVTALVLGRRG